MDSGKNSIAEQSYKFNLKKSTATITNLFLHFEQLFYPERGKTQAIQSMNSRKLRDFNTRHAVDFLPDGEHFSSCDESADISRNCWARGQL